MYIINRRARSVADDTSTSKTPPTQCERHPDPLQPRSLTPPKAETETETLSTLNPKLPKPATLSPKPTTLNPKPSTPNPQPSTPNPKPSTLDPKP